MLQQVTTYSEALLNIKNSKFLSYCFSVDSKDLFHEELLRIKQNHPQANHHCYAYRLGKVQIEERANDDGEPSGTAGLPILNCLKSKGLSNSAIVVVRYFGGTKLGSSGLIKSYRQAAEKGIENNDLAILELRFFCHVKFPYGITSTVEQIIHRESIFVERKDYGEAIELTLSSNSDIYPLIANELKPFDDCIVKDLGSQ